MTVKKHSPIGPSSVSRVWACPGSAILSEGLVVDDENVHSATGTVAHSLAEQALKSAQFDLEDQVGRTEVEGSFEIEITEEMVENVQVYVDTVLRDADVLGLKREDILCEAAVSMPHIDPEARGTSDAVLVAPMYKICVYDYKNGRGVVEVKNNKQLLMYALGAYYSIADYEREGITHIQTCIVQPRAPHVDGPVRYHTYTLAELLEFEKGLVDAVKRYRDKDTTLSAGTHCAFCPAKPVCPAIREDLQQRTTLEFTRMDEAITPLPKASALTPEQLSNLLQNAELVRDWAKSVVEYASAIANTGIEIPGYKLVSKKGTRKWVNPADVEAAFILEFGDDIYKTELKSPAAMERLLKKRKGELANYIETPITGTTLVPSEDKRLAVGAPGAAVNQFEHWV